MEVNLFDYSNLSGNTNFFIWNPSKDITYLLPDSHKPGLINLYVDEHILTPRTETNNVGLLLEPRCIKPQLYDILDHRSLLLKPKFKKIITHDDILLDRYPDFYKSLPFTGGSLLLESMHKIYDKPKLSTSIIASQKKESIGHRLRHYVISKFAKKYNITAYGPEYTNLYTYPQASRDNLVDYYKYITGDLSRAYADSMFMIVIENQRQEFFFTEKIIDCFLSGTIPIYCGAYTIGDAFDINGILVFNSLEELETILQSLSVDLYKSKMNALTINFKLAQAFKSYDSHLCRMLNEH